jgi:hypothetical protein
MRLLYLGEIANGRHGLLRKETLRWKELGEKDPRSALAEPRVEIRALRGPQGLRRRLIGREERDRIKREHRILIAERCRIDLAQCDLIALHGPCYVRQLHERLIVVQRDLDGASRLLFDVGEKLPHVQRQITIVGVARRHFPVGSRRGSDSDRRKTQSQQDGEETGANDRAHACFLSLTGRPGTPRTASQSFSILCYAWTRCRLLTIVCTNHL